MPDFNNAVIFVFGPRASAKSTLIRQLVARTSNTVIADKDTVAAGILAPEARKNLTPDALKEQAEIDYEKTIRVAEENLALRKNVFVLGNIGKRLAKPLMKKFVDRIDENDKPVTYDVCFIRLTANPDILYTRLVKRAYERDALLFDRKEFDKDFYRRDAEENKQISDNKSKIRIEQFDTSELSESNQDRLLARILEFSFANVKPEKRPPLRTLTPGTPMLYAKPSADTAATVLGALSISPGNATSSEVSSGGAKLANATGADSAADVVAEDGAVGSRPSSEMGISPALGPQVAPGQAKPALTL
jgi:hypothetical protein